MPRYVAFLRGINLGKRRVTSDELREHFAALGFTDVATFIASGNVIFAHADDDTPALERRIETDLPGMLGFESDTFLRELGALATLAEDPAIAAARGDGFNVHVIFVRGAVEPAVRDALRSLEGPDDRFHVREREVVWFRRGRLSEAPIADRDLAAALGSRENTMRNFNTVERIVAKFGEDA